MKSYEKPQTGTSDEEAFSTPTERTKGSGLEDRVPQQKNECVESTLEV